MGEKFKDYLVGKIDATVNEVPGFPAVHSFPTIKLYRWIFILAETERDKNAYFSNYNHFIQTVVYRTDGTEAEYNGERTVEGLTKFLNTDGVYGMAAPDDEPPKPKKDEL